MEHTDCSSICPKGCSGLKVVSSIPHFTSLVFDAFWTPGSSPYPEKTCWKFKRTVPPDPCTTLFFCISIAQILQVKNVGYALRRMYCKKSFLPRHSSHNDEHIKSTLWFCIFLSHFFKYYFTQ